MIYYVISGLWMISGIVNTVFATLHFSSDYGSKWASGACVVGAVFGYGLAATYLIRGVM